MREDIAKVLLDEEQIRQRVAELAEDLADDYVDKQPVLVGTLKGAFVFLADLMRALDFPVCVDFISAASYGDAAASSGDVKLELSICGDLTGKHVIIIEDIVDTGRTLASIVATLRSSGCASVRTCCLLDKPSRRTVEFKPDYIGFEIPDHFVVGYGLDYAERYRNLPFVGVLKPEVYAE